MKKKKKIAKKTPKSKAAGKKKTMAAAKTGGQAPRSKVVPLHLKELEPVVIEFESLVLEFEPVIIEFESLVLKFESLVVEQLVLDQPRIEPAVQLLGGGAGVKKLILRKFPVPGGSGDAHGGPAGPPSLLSEEVPDGCPHVLPGALGKQSLADAARREGPRGPRPPLHQPDGAPEQTRLRCTSSTASSRTSTRSSTCPSGPPRSRGISPST